MAGLVGVPGLSQLSAGHSAVYEAYFRQADVKGTGKLGAGEAALFLKKSNLKEGILHKIWELCDPQGTGFLDKHRFFLALRLIALAQNGKEVVISNLSLLVPAPNLGDISPSVPPPAESNVWSVKPADKTKYDHIFEGLKPVNGLLPGDKVKPVLLNSKLPIDVLGRVWDLSDIDRDGMLDADEFAVAMHLVYRALEGDMVPLTLPGRMVPPSKRKLKHPGSSGPASPLVSNMPTSSASPVSGMKNITSDTQSWVVPAADKLKYDSIFKTTDKDTDGLVSGEEVKNVFIQSGLAQPVLAHIWGLCDLTNSGRLNAEQFALAMYLIKQKVNGVDPPQKLTPEMIPPSMRGCSPSGSDDSKDGPGNILTSLGDFSAIKELDKITKDIEDLGREKMGLQREIDEKEEMIRQRNTEIQNLQSDLEKTKLSVQELEKQRLEAQSKLDDFDKEKCKYEEMLTELKQKCQEQTKLVADLKSQMQNSQKSIVQQEEELGEAKEELNKLREEESKLEQDINSSKEYLETVQKQCKSIQGEINQVRSKLNTLNETNSSLQSQIAHYNSLMNSNSIPTTSVTNSLPISDFSPLTDAFDMTPTPSETDAMSVRATAGSSPVSSISGFSVGSGRVDEAVDDFKDKETGDDYKDGDPFKSKENLFSSADADSTDPFHSDDPFKSDPFHYKSVSFADPFAADPFAGDEELFKNDPFKSEMSANSEEPGSQSASANGLSSSPSKSDPFAAVDPFGSAFSSSKRPGDSLFGSEDPFKPSNEDSNKTPTNQKKSFGSGKDLFGGDPFGSEDPFAAS
ncbi:epidermal growth factor receptor substrate 15-like 1 isoform X2 [Nematostella vectensis]|uniref:epidermal growth factor receptor substrate 15-like 1 isoform X2 n=1 Tax=Nematostella vectensis TaxID=45351 RepID=UPI002076F92C|nr:epidermal growth factor receptor substrate 15-like 1 isoform X2 [Nematostella vectensis]